MSPLFAQWQPVYADHNIPTFPCRPDKRPAVRNYGSFGLRASAQIVQSFPTADAFGFMCGPRSKITVLDVDSKDERILSDAINKHGNTPIIARSGSGHYQAWYKH